jgi:tripartite-type tricarboxylate transporter receptor subunit TctC
MEELLLKIGGSMLHVPYRGGAAAVTGVLGDQAQFMLAGIAPALGHSSRPASSNAVAVTQGRRASILPEVPTIGESIPGFALETWFGLFAPAGTPPSVVQKLGAAVKDVLARPDIRDKLTQLGIAVNHEPGDAMARLIRSDIARYQELAKKIKFEAN